MVQIMSEEHNTTQLRDINERIQDLIVESLRTSEILYVKGDLINAYKAIKNVFWKIAPFDFKNKEYLIISTRNIDQYLAIIESTGAKPDMKKILEVNNQRSELKILIEEYFQLIPHCLKELNLYLRIIKKNDDPDEVFSEQTFNTNESLLKHKIKELKTISDVDLFLKELTPKQIHDVHSRLLTYPGHKGMKRLPYDPEDKKE